MIAGKLRMLTLLIVCLGLTLVAVRRGVLPQSITSRAGIHSVSSPPVRDTLTMSVPVEIVETGKVAEHREISVVVDR
ncbi:MAG: hypothetical protein JWO82_2256 [Akkermansiaceae bacterium]|nr:hypothetical protein [Akkermansiaceae bacterium]